MFFLKKKYRNIISFCYGLIALEKVLHRDYYFYWRAKASGPDITYKLNTEMCWYIPKQSRCAWLTSFHGLFANSFLKICILSHFTGLTQVALIHSTWLIYLLIALLMRHLSDGIKVYTNHEERPQLIGFIYCPPFLLKLRVGHVTENTITRFVKSRS